MDINQRISVRDLSQEPPTGQRVTVCGAIQEVHEGPLPVFSVNDGSSIKSLRVILAGTEISDNGTCSPGATLMLYGEWTTWKESGLCQEKVPMLAVKAMQLLGDADPDTYPLAQSSSQSTGALHKHPHLRIRTPYHALLARVRSATTSALVNFFDSHPGGPFYQVHTPILTWTDCEGGAEVFAAQTQTSKKATAETKDTFFGSRRFLNVSAVFHGEAFVQGLDRIWTLAPCWRPEGADAPRYLSEFWMLEVAVNYVDDLEPLIRLAEETVRGVVLHLQQSAAGKEMLAYRNLHERWAQLLSSPWPRITYAEALELLCKARAEQRVTFECDNHGLPEWAIEAEHERYLAAHLGRPVFLTHFPTHVRLFQARQSAASVEDIPLSKAYDPSETTETFDVLVPEIGEICSGGLREHRLDALIAVMRKKGFLKRNESTGRPVERANAAADARPYPFLHADEDLKSVEWLADLRRWGTAPHGGFGFGFERLLLYLVGEDSVKEVVSFPRYKGVCAC